MTSSFLEFLKKQAFYLGVDDFGNINPQKFLEENKAIEDYAIRVEDLGEWAWNRAINFYDTKTGGLIDIREIFKGFESFAWLEIAKGSLGEQEIKKRIEKLKEKSK